MQDFEHFSLNGLPVESAEPHMLFAKAFRESSDSRPKLNAVSTLQMIFFLRLLSALKINKQKTIEFRLNAQNICSNEN